ncbi:MAG TPA: hypothetical protein VMS31_14595 [Pyrinomonadaceae bacterium]|nr:hypothetical protein [Pyrinomonadaceae bacterium]
MKTTNCKLQFIGLVLMLCCFGSSAAQPKPAPFLKRLIGTWQGEGKAFGMEARMQIKWEEVLGNKFVRLSLKNEMRTPTGQTQVFEGHAYYQSTAEGLYEAKWFDSRGTSFPIKGRVEDEALIAFWGTPEQEQGKSVYRLLGTGKLEVVDSVKQKDGSWREFGRFVLVREP